MQAEAWRSLHLPGLLVADARLGGISATISAFETLLLRGRPPTAIVSVQVSPDATRMQPFACGAHMLARYHAFGPTLLQHRA